MSRGASVAEPAVGAEDLLDAGLTGPASAVDVDEVAPDDVAPDDEESPSESAYAVAEFATAIPIPSATASAPTRPT